MPIPKPTKGVAVEDGGATLLARIVGNDAANVTQASVSSITYQVFKRGATTDIAAASPLTVSAVIFDTLQTGDEWTVDATGYNFKYVTDVLELPDGKSVFIFEFKVTPTSGPPFYLLFEINTLGLIGS